MGREGKKDREIEREGEGLNNGLFVIKHIFTSISHSPMCTINSLKNKQTRSIFNSNVIL